MEEHPLSVTKKTRVYTATHLAAAGFEYTGDGDTARCKHCNLEVSNWTLQMDPLNIHWEKKPDCPYTQYFVAAKLLGASLYSSTSNECKNLLIEQQIETIISGSLSNILVETDSIQQVRRRTFSHWPYRTTPSSAQMVEAGFFQCNVPVRDRVICIYCNLICQQWKPNSDDPWKVHKTLSPGCSYVQAQLIRLVTVPIPIIYGDSSEETTKAIYESFRSNLSTPTAACHPAYAVLPKRHESFATWPSKTSAPPIDDMVQAGFFYTGEKGIVTCFYCNGSIKDLNQHNYPMITHARLLPHCAYAKILCGNEKYHEIQAYRAEQERIKMNQAREKANSTANGRHSSTVAEDALSKVVADRLALPMSQHMLDKNFPPSIIEGCWKYQLRSKKVDFHSEDDLYMACLILQKQTEHIDGKPENITIPNKKMKEIQIQSHQLLLDMLIMSIVWLSSSVEPVSLISSQNETEMMVNDQEQSSNLCVLCLKEERKLACIPCGHLTTCLPCGHFLRSCSMCHKNIQAFVKIYF